MAGSEENLLKEYFDGLSGQVEEISEIKLNAAIRSGMSGPRSYRISAGKRYSIGIAAVLAIVILFAFPWIGKQAEPQNAQSPLVSAQSSNAFEAYRKVASGNITVSSAIDAGLVQRISGASAQQNGYVLTVDGIAADRKGILILYSLQNNTSRKSQVNRLQLAGEGYSAVNYPNGWSPKDVQPGITLGYEVLQWGGDFRSLPDQITFELNLGEKTKTATSSGVKPLAQLSVPITLDHDKMAKTGELIHVDRTLTIAGQEVDVNEVYISTTGIYVEEEYNPQNSKQIFGLLNPRMLLGSEDQFMSLSSFRTLVVEGKKSLVFANDNNSKQPLRLQIDGIHALAKDATELIIDTEKQQIIKAPDKNLKVSVNSTAEGSTMILEYYTPLPTTRFSDSIILLLDDEFKDASGQVYSTIMSDISIPARKESSDKAALPPTLYYYALGKAKLPQPLTFTLNGYPNPLKETVSLSIRK
ncbi:DUF4179 domain-containing protein [Paenibacillus sp. sgz500992]|uniref:DUF4179 domain-containing protein n=1 Tax=Paenibacillus sp. sgz500992 TaxID=3242476 RepID=UPI0036D24498